MTPLIGQGIPLPSPYKSRKDSYAGRRRRIKRDSRPINPAARRAVVCSELMRTVPLLQYVLIESPYFEGKICVGKMRNGSCSCLAHVFQKFRIACQKLYISFQLFHRSVLNYETVLPML